VPVWPIVSKVEASMVQKKQSNSILDAGYSILVQPFLLQPERAGLVENRVSRNEVRE
jgi:hypothetical protein